MGQMIFRHVTQGMTDESGKLVQPARELEPNAR